jgi:hypothetical protein
MNIVIRDKFIFSLHFIGKARCSSVSPIQFITAHLDAKSASDAVCPAAPGHGTGPVSRRRVASVLSVVNGESPLQ